MTGIAGDIGIAGCVHGDAIAEIQVAAAEIRGVDEARACGLSFATKALLCRLAVCPGAWRSGEIGGIAHACDVGVAGQVHGDTHSVITATASK